MTVIPWIVNGHTGTVVTSKESFDAAGGEDSDAVYVSHLDEDQFAEPNTNASYDLRVGAEYRDHRDRGKMDLSSHGEVVLPPGAAIIIETAEHVHFPKSVFGHIVPRVSLLQKGLSNTSSKVDPGYHGPLLVTVFNLGKTKVTLRRGQPFCCLYLLSVRDGIRPYSKDPKRIAGRTTLGLWSRMRDFLERNVAAIMVLLLVVYIAQAVVSVGKTLYESRVSAEKPSSESAP